MKTRTLLLAAAIAAFTLVQSGCTPEQMAPNQGATSENVIHKLDEKGELSWLVLTSVEQLDDVINFLDNADATDALVFFEKSQGYVSMRSFYGEDYLDSIGIIDDVLTTLLNPKGTIQIGSKIITLNLINEYAMVVDTSLLTDTSYISMDEDFNDFMDGIVKPEKIHKSASSVTKGRKRLDSFSCNMPFHSVVDYKIKCIAAVNNGWFRSSIKAKISRRSACGGVPYLSVTSDNGHYQLKKSSVSYTINHEEKGGVKKSYVATGYKGSKQVKKGDQSYLFVAHFRAYDVYDEQSLSIVIPVFVNQ
ncbi:MAG: hypothetical protein IJ524_02930 [Bacteroidales bacterium]|nr:hypothetical protein [Bacteroidales bacterium]